MLAKPLGTLPSWRSLCQTGEGQGALRPGQGAAHHQPANPGSDSSAAPELGLFRRVRARPFGSARIVQAGRFTSARTSRYPAADVALQHLPPRVEQRFTPVFRLLLKFDDWAVRVGLRYQRDARERSGLAEPDPSMQLVTVALQPALYSGPVNERLGKSSQDPCPQRIACGDLRVGIRVVHRVRGSTLSRPS